MSDAVTDSPPKDNVFTHFIENLKFDPKLQNIAVDFLYCAEQDLQASKLLYDSNIFTLSIYHLQQCVEKLIKAWLLYFSIITLKEVKKIGHNSPKGFLELFKSSLYSKLMNDLDLQGNLKTSEDKINSLFMEAETEKIAYMSRESILDCLKLFNDIGNVAIGHPVVSNKEREALQIHLTRKGIKHSVDLYDKKWNDFGMAGCKLLILSIITFPHWSDSRYPDGIIKPKNYNNSLGIVAAFKEVYENIYFVTETFKKILVKKK